MEISNSERLFWKVYRNCWLNKQIYIQLESFDSHDDFKPKNIKFKHIFDLEWMIYHSQYQLLKYKLKSNEHVHIGKAGLIKLIGLTNSPNTMKSTHDIAIELFILLLEKQRKQIKTFDIDVFRRGRKAFILEIYFSCIKLNSISVIHLDQIIKHCSPAVALSIMAKNIGFAFSKQIKDNSILWAFKFNKYYRNEMVMFILETPELYSIPTPTFKENQKSFLFGNEIEFLQLYEIFKIDSSDIQNKLIDIDYYRNSYNLNQWKFIVFQLFQSKEITVELLLLLFKIYFKCCILQSSIPFNVQQGIDQIINNSNSNKEEKQKELLKLLIIQSRSCKLYILYFYNYYELIDVNGINGLSHLYKYNGILKVIEQLEINGDHLEIIKFIESFSNQLSIKGLVNHKKLIKKVRELICKSMDTKESYSNAIESINETKRDIFNLPEQWDPLLKDLVKENDETLVIKHKKSIEWYKTISPTKKYYFTKNFADIYLCKLYDGKVEFEKNVGYEIVEKEVYANHPILKSLQWSQINNNPLSPLINELEYNNTDINRPSNYIIVQLIKDLSSETKNINNLQFKFDLIYDFITQIKQENEKDPERIIKVLSNVKIDLSNYIIQSLQLLINSIVEYDTKTSILVLNGIQFDCNLDKFEKIWDDSLNPRGIIKNFQKICQFGDVYCNSIDNYENLVNYIKFWVGYIIKVSPNDKSGSINDALVIYSKIINFLFKKLIQISNIQLNVVRQVIELVSSLKKFGIELEHSFYHSFYYLHILSPRLSRFLILFDNFQINQQYQYKKEIFSNEIDNIKSFVNILDPNKYTFHYFFSNENSETILKHQIFNMFLNGFNNYLINSNKIYLFSINNYLNYLIDINRVDLYFQTLELLQTKMLNTKCLTTNYIQENSNEINLLIKILSKSFSFYSIETHLIKIIDILLFINGGGKYHSELVQDFLNTACQTNRSDIVSLLINNYNIIEFKGYLKIEIPWSIYKYICINHPQVIFESTNLLKIQYYRQKEQSLDLVKQIIKYNPQTIIIQNSDIQLFLKRGLYSNNKILLEYLYKKGLIKKEENSINNYFV